MLTAALSKTMDSDMIAIQQSGRSGGNLQKIRTLSKAQTLDQIERASEDFEAQFISQLVGTMFSTLDAKESLGGTDEEEQFQSLLMDQYGKLIARQGGIGVADQVKREMLKLQEVE